MTRRTWVAVAAVTLTLAGGAVLAVVRGQSAAEPPQADLLQPEPAVPEPAGRLPISRWPLGAPANHRPNWSHPRMEEPPPADPVQTTARFAAESPPVEPPDWLDRPAPTPKERPLPLTGTCAAVVEGGVLTLPPPFRRQLGDVRDAAGRGELFVTPGPDGCLWLTTAAGLRRLGDELRQSGQSAKRVRQARRVAFAQTEACAVDRDGRLRLPDQFVRSAGLQQQVVLVGVGDRLELWDAARWDAYLRKATSPATPPPPAPVP